MTPKSYSCADQVREMGLSIGGVIVGRETYNNQEWSEVELTLIFVGETIAVFKQRSRNSLALGWRDVRESANWTLEYRDWNIQNVERL